MSTPKQIEQWRVEFESDVLNKLGAALGKEHALWRGTHYYNALTNSHWEAYLARAEHELALHAQKDARIAELERHLDHLMVSDMAQSSTIATLEARLKEIECPQCKGRGFTDEGDPEIGSAMMDCDHCNSTGRLHPPAQPASEAVQVPDGLAAALQAGFMTCNSDGGNKLYSVHIYCRSLSDAQELHRILALAAAPKPEKGA